MSANPTGAISAVGKSILLSALDGEIPLTAVDDLGAQVDEEPTKRKSLVLDAVRSLLSRGCIVLGRFDAVTDQKSEWRDWTGTLDVQIDRLAEAYTPEVEDWESWGFLCWFALAPDGEKVAEALQAGERALQAKGELAAGLPLGSQSRNEHVNVNPITPERLAHIASECEDRDLHSVWFYFDTPGGDPWFPHSLMTFEERREGFLWTVKQLFEHGYIEMLRDGGVPFPGPIDDKLDALRQAFPADDEGMEEGMWFFFPECPMGSNWKWPNQAEPIPFLPGGESAVPLTDGNPARRRLEAPGVGPVEQGSSEILASAHVRYIATALHDWGLAGLWGYFLHPNGYPEVPHWCETYPERIDGFCWTARRLVTDGYARLQRREPRDDQPTLDELVAELRASMPDDVNEFRSAGNSRFFYRLCPIVITWVRHQPEE